MAEQRLRCGAKKKCRVENFELRMAEHRTVRISGIPVWRREVLGPSPEAIRHGLLEQTKAYLSEKWCEEKDAHRARRLFEIRFFVLELGIGNFWMIEPEIWSEMVAGCPSFRCLLGVFG